jgi:hypothetical protein
MEIEEQCPFQFDLLDINREEFSFKDKLVPARPGFSNRNVHEPNILPNKTKDDVEIISSSLVPAKAILC